MLSHCFNTIKGNRRRGIEESKVKNRKREKSGSIQALPRCGSGLYKEILT
jgi:hypothetical protein